MGWILKSSFFLPTKWKVRLKEDQVESSYGKFELFWGSYCPPPQVPKKKPGYTTNFLSQTYEMQKRRNVFMQIISHLSNKIQLIRKKIQSPSLANGSITDLCVREANMNRGRFPRCLQAGAKSFGFFLSTLDHWANLGGKKLFYSFFV